MGIVFHHRGDFSKTLQFLNKIARKDYRNVLDKYGREGVAALSAATPVKTGLTASSWTYEIVEDANGCTISWLNTNVNQGVNVAVILDLGHGTGRGTYVVGRHYISPAIEPIMDRIADEAWKEMTNV